MYVCMHIFVYMYASIMEEYAGKTSPDGRGLDLCQ